MKVMKAHRQVRDVMSRSVISVTPKTGFQRMVELMQDHAVSALPVVDEGGRPLGIVSEDDLLARERSQVAVNGAAWAERWRLGGDRRRSTARSAAELMTAPAITVALDAALAVAARRMHDANVRRLVVVDAVGRMVGVVSRRDLLLPYRTGDSEIRTAVLDSIRARAAWSDVSKVGVIVEHGVVRLTGEVEYRSEALAIASLARIVDGVVDVDDRLLCREEDVRGGTNPDEGEPVSA
jgi:CBS domain-containing protein